VFLLNQVNHDCWAFNDLHIWGFRALEVIYRPHSAVTRIHWSADCELRH
jgi:hypothetical protein